MTYVVSDIHGHYNLYLDFLGLVGFSSADTLYVIGDILDRGDSAISLIQDIMQRKNVIAIRGNHEQMLLPVLNELNHATPKDVEKILEQEIAIQQIGQEITLRDFAKLTTKQQNDIIDFIENMPCYAEIKVKDQGYILVHAGLPDFSDIPMEYYDENELLFGPHDYYINHFKDTKLIVGHLPTRFISRKSEDKILHIKDTIAIDCGLGFGGQLGAICLETMEEFYIK